MFRYVQSTGEFYRDGELIGVGYSGLEECKNQPDCESIKGRGPLPRGSYRIGPPFAHLVTVPTLAGPILPLALIRGESYGRMGFLIHGDNETHTASHGCIVMPHDVRVAIASSHDRDLEVVPE